MIALDFPSTAAFSPPPILFEPAGRRGSDLVEPVPPSTARRIVRMARTTSVDSRFDEARAADDPLSEAAARWQNQLQIQVAVIKRLIEIRRDAQLSGDPISETSLRDFRAFLRKAQSGKRPSIFLLDNGNIRALWLNDKKEQVGLQFLGEGEVQFVIFARRPNMMAREHGTESLSAMLARVGASGATHLIR